MIWRPSSYANFFQPTTQPKETNPQPNLNTTLLRIIIIINIYRGAQEIRHSRWVSKSWNRYFKQLLRSYPGHFTLCFCWLFELNKSIFCFLSRSHTISTICILRCILPVGKTPHRTICTTPLQSVLEVGLHSQLSFVVTLTDQFDAFFSPKKCLGD